MYKIFVFRGDWESRRDRHSSLSSDGQEDMYHHQHDPLLSRKTNSRYSPADSQVIKVTILNCHKALFRDLTLFIFPAPAKNQWCE